MLQTQDEFLEAEQFPLFYEHRETLIECMNKIEETSKQTTTINQACGISRILQDPTGWGIVYAHRRNRDF
jgi:hypothetical protein